MINRHANSIKIIPSVLFAKEKNEEEDDEDEDDDDENDDENDGENDDEELVKLATLEKSISGNSPFFVIICLMLMTI